MATEIKHRVVENSTEDGVMRVWACDSQAEARQLAADKACEIRQEFQDDGDGNYRVVYEEGFGQGEGSYVVYHEGRTPTPMMAYDFI